MVNTSDTPWLDGRPGRTPGYADMSYPATASALVLDACERGGGAIPHVCERQDRDVSQPVPRGEPRPDAAVPVADQLIDFLLSLGVTHAFGVSGGGIAPLWARLLTSPIRTLHFRHETGAAFSATQHYFMTGRPTVLFVTTGPGFTNALSGLFSARWDGAKVVVISGGTAPEQRGRWAFQEMGPHEIPRDLMTSGPLFHFAQLIDGLPELADVQRRIAGGLASRSSFLAHLSIAPSLQCAASGSPGVSRIDRLAGTHAVPATPPALPESVIDTCAAMLQEGPFAIWVGFGARGAAREVRELAARTGAAVMCSPRAKGIFPEDDPQFVGVTGTFGGHDSVTEYMERHQPLRTLVLGTRLGESTSAWSSVLVPSRGFIQVDVDPTSIGAGYPDAETFGVQSEIGAFVTRLLARFSGATPSAKAYPRPDPPRLLSNQAAGVRPEALMLAVQELVVDRGTPLLADVGNSFAWTNHLLRFRRANQYWVSSGFGCMGSGTTGVIGAAIAAGDKAVAIVGDGAMLMANEVSTAVKYDVGAVWIVLNDSSYGMVEQGMRSQGASEVDTDLPKTDFVKMAEALGARGICVSHERQLRAALEAALATPGPVVIDVLIERTARAPFSKRIRTLLPSGACSEWAP